MILESLEQVVKETPAGTLDGPQELDSTDLEYWNLALDALGHEGLLPAKKFKYPEDPGELDLGEKTFAFKKYDAEAKREETLELQKRHEADPESFLPKE
jgi:hypothetical protein